MTRRWPDHLWIVRHGQSAGNVASDAAYAAGHPAVDIAFRDMDVPLSDLGHQQAAALGRWFNAVPAGERPTTLITSPYTRAMQTADAIVSAGGGTWNVGRHVDERLREREFGILGQLTTFGIRERFPEQAALRARLGKFYHRPPGGESWCDVILRLRSVLDTISLHHTKPGTRVLIVAHQVVVLCFRYLIEELTEQEILAIDREADVANCGVTQYVRGNETPADANDAAMTLVRYNFVTPLEREGAAVTGAPDVPTAPR